MINSWPRPDGERNWAECFKLKGEYYVVKLNKFKS